MAIETEIRTPDGLVSTEALLLLDPQADRARKEMSVYKPMGGCTCVVLICVIICAYIQFNMGSY